MARACLRAAALALLASNLHAQAPSGSVSGETLATLPEPQRLEAKELLNAERGLETRVPVPPSPVLPAALSCATPTTSGPLQATHPYYDVFLDSAGGAFTARTGSLHSVTALAGSPQNVIYGGAGGSPGTSDVTWHFHIQDVNYNNPGGGSACVFDPPDTPMEPNSVGVEQEFHVTPEPGIDCILRQEIVAFGTSEANSGVRLTLSTTNMASSSSLVVVGVRWQTDYQNTTDDGPLFATVTCDPPVVEREWSTEHELAPSEIRDFYRIQNNSGFPIFSNVTSTTSISGIPDTSTPDRLVYGYWPNLRASGWNYVPNEGGCCPDSDSAVLWYFGYLPADADVINPGETKRHTIVIFSSADNIDCGVFVPSCATSVTSTPQDQHICLGDWTTLDASGVTLTDCTGTVDYTWGDGVSTWPGPSINVNPSATTRYDVAVTCSTDPGCEADYSATVTVDRAPEFLPPLAADPDPCTSGVKLTWNDATFYGGAGGSYNVRRSEISCADAALQSPVVTRLSVPRWYDATTLSGHAYYYVVEAEDAVAGTACRPTGPNGGAVTTLCATAITDTIDENPPAGVGAVLFASHAGDQVAFRWPGVRALAPGEHFHLKKTVLDPRTTFQRVNSEADLTMRYAETDTSSWLQFFDLRIANQCERESSPDYPPGLP